MGIKSVINKLIKKNRQTKKIKKILTAAGCPKNFIERVIEEQKISHDTLAAIVSHTQKTKLEEQIRLFLRKRWALIHRTDLAYTSFPHHPFNQLCMHLAQAVLKPGELWAEILMPTLVIKDYDITADSLAELTETEENNTKQLALCEFIVSEDGKAIIPFLPWFRVQAENGCEFFNHLYSDESKLVALSEREKNWLRHSAMPASDNFFEEFDLRKKLVGARGTLAEALLRLCDGLMENGQGGKGESAEAHHDVFEYIQEFAQILSKIPEDQRNEILALETNYFTFGDYWRIISGDDWVRRPAGQTTCVEINSAMLKNILQAFPDKFAAIKLDQTLSDDAQAITPFEKCLERIANTIDSRKQTLAARNLVAGESVLKIFYLDSQNTFDAKFDAYKWHLEHTLTPPESVTHPIESQGALDYFHSFFSEKDRDQLLRNLNMDKLKNLYTQSVNSENTFFAEFLLSKSYFTPPIDFLFSAISDGKIEIVRAWISAKRDFNERISWTPDVPFPYSALSYAMHQKQQEISLLLIEAGADLNEEYGDANEPILIWAIHAHLDEIAKALIKRGVNLEAKSLFGRTALHFAVKYQNISLVRSLLDNHANIEAANASGSTPLHEALIYFDLPIIRLLLERGADHRTVSANKVTPLSRAVLQGNLEAIRLLLVDTTHLNFEDSLRETPLYIAIRRNNVAIFSLLLEHGADINHKNIEGKSPLHTAMLCINEEIACALIVAGADLSEKYRHRGETKSLLSRAISGQMFDVCIASLDAGVDLCSEPRNTLNQVLERIFSQCYPKLYEPAIKKLIYAGATVPDLARLLRRLHIALKPAELLQYPRLPELKTLHGFEGLCELVGIKNNSLEALKLFAACLEKEIRQLPKNIELADRIHAAVHSNFPFDLCEIIRESRGHSSSYSRALPATDFWDGLPEALKALAKSYDCPSHKRSYIQFA